MHKTGSTFLQRYVFPSIEAVHYLKTPHLVDLSRCMDSEKLVISSEGLTGIPWRYPGQEKHSWAEDRAIILRNLKTLFPEVYIIIGFRKHADLIRSLYKQYLHEGGYLRLEEFFNFDQEPIISPRDLHFKEIIVHLGELFGQRIFSFVFDDLKNGERLMEGLTHFLGVPPITVKKPPGDYNRGVRDIQSRILRVLNRAANSQLNPDGFLPLNNVFFRRFGLTPRDFCQRRLSTLSEKDIELDPDLKARLDEYYEHDWNEVLEFVQQCRSYKRQPSP